MTIYIDIPVCTKVRNTKTKYYLGEIWLASNYVTHKVSLQYISGEYFMSLSFMIFPSLCYYSWYIKHEKYSIANCQQKLSITLVMQTINSILYLFNFKNCGFLNAKCLTFLLGIYYPFLS